MNCHLIGFFFLLLLVVLVSLSLIFLFSFSFCLKGGNQKLINDLRFISLFISIWHIKIFAIIMEICGGLNIFWVFFIHLTFRLNFKVYLIINISIDIFFTSCYYIRSFWEPIWMKLTTTTFIRIHYTCHYVTKTSIEI